MNRGLHLVFGAFAAFLVCGLGGCRRDMQDQPKYKPLQPSTFFADHRSARPLPAGTIARGQLDLTDPAHTGVDQGVFLSSIPVKVDAQLLHRGQQRYNIYCTPCHGALADGKGMVAKRGLKWPSDLTSEREREAPPGYIFQVISNGYGAMPDYSAQIDAHDRWAIIAYLRALQLSRHARVADVAPEAKSQLGVQP